MAFTSLGLNTASRYYYLRNRKRGRAHRNVQIIVLAALIAILPSIGLSLFGLTIAGEAHAPLGLFIGTLAVSCYFAMFRQLAYHIFIIENKKKLSIFFDAIVSNLGFALFLLLAPDSDLQTALIGLLAISTLSGAAAVTQLLREARTGVERPHGLLPPRRLTRTMLALAFPAMIAQAGGILLNKIDVLMVAPLAGAAAAGDYSVALRLTHISTFGGSVLMALAAGRLIAAASDGPSEQAWHAMKTLTLWQGAIVAATAAPLFLFAEPLVALVYGAGYASSVSPFLLLQAGKVLSSALAPAVIMFTALGFSGELARATLVAVAINVGLNCALIPSMGAIGAALATLVTLTLLAGFQVRLMLEVRRQALLLPREVAA
jgi:O-antigen/teichoic acid export membrane protein